MSTLNPSVRYHIDNLLPIIDNKIELALYLVGNGIPEPKAKNDEGYKARLLCVKWWRRTLDRLQGRVDESKLIGQGRVAKHKEKYSSNLTVHRVGKKACKTAEFLKTQSMISNASDMVDMATIVQSSLANPTNRRAELMIRMAGFEAYAQQHGYVGEFYTLTCPSSYHRFSGVKLNDKYQELTPKDAQIYLVKQWSKIRAAYGRLDIKPFGFRVAEPHHDGCPHWHMLLFVKVENRNALREIISKYALEVDGQEPGADKHRFKYVEIDAEAGTATGYIAKYISKNLGFSIDDPEHDTTNASQSYGQRVKAWASVWGIRQFQQIGGAPVTVWRQLRKLREALDDELLESARQAADESRWADYLVIMGGVDAKRLEQTITLVKTQLVDNETGELKQNQYFEYVTLIFGVASLAAQAITRTKQWAMVSTKIASSMLANAPVSGVAGRGCFAPWSSVNNCTA
ncbi:replication endonuclease [Methylobacter sp.]|uniref:replication endonuclease n=1 Tax=Methylobacter sp. TaxID=2051955 RepID=UPI002FDDD0F8